MQLMEKKRCKVEFWKGDSLIRKIKPSVQKDGSGFIQWISKSREVFSLCIASDAIFCCHDGEWLPYESATFTVNVRNILCVVFLFCRDKRKKSRESFKQGRANYGN